MAFGDLEYRCDPARATLVLVDVQVDFCTDVTADGRRPRPQMEQMATRLVPLVEAARRAAVPVVFVQTIHDAASDSEAWRSRRGALVAYERELCKPGSEGAEFFAVAPVAGEAVVVKHRYDAFVGTELDVVLRALGREAVIATGVMTDICVETTVRHALCLDYLTTTVSDCCAAGDEEQHEGTLRRLARSFGLVASAAELAALWKVDLGGAPASADRIDQDAAVPQGR